MPAAAAILALPTLNGVTTTPPPINGDVAFVGKAVTNLTAVQKLPGIGIGSNVVTMNLVNVRATPAGTLLGTQPSGATALVALGPVSKLLGAEMVIWWSLKFSSGVNGYVGGDNLKVVAAGPTPTYMSAQVRITSN